MEALESEIMVKINDALSQYNDVMYHLLDAIKSEQQFITKHKELKVSVIKKFKEKCLLKDDDYRDLQISKLEKAINDSCNEFHDRLFNEMKKSGSFYEKFVNDSFTSYAELMEEFFKDNTSISEDELENLHQNIFKDVLSEFENNFQNDEDFSVIESNRRALEIKIMNEFQSIKGTNRIRNESNEKSDMKLKLEIQFLIEYKDRMDKIIPFCNNETELLKQHLEIQYIIKQNMIDSNLFSNPKALEPYLTKLEVEINKSFIDFNIIFKVNLDKQLLSLKNVIMNARKFYRDEMQKYYADTNFLKHEKLILFNSSVTDRTIAKYQSERGNMTIEKFDKAIKGSLKDIYYDFVEENDKNTPTLPAIGIYLGTTNSSVAYYQPSIPKGQTIIISNRSGNRKTPNFVAFNDNNEEIIGELAKDESFGNFRNTIYSVRLIGRKFDDKNVQNEIRLWPFRVVDDGNNFPKICVEIDGNNKFFKPEEILAKILKELKRTCQDHLGFEVKNAVITVPAYFSGNQKEATKDAGKIAGLNVLKIINEPTAAAIAFQLNRSDDLDSRRVLVYNFGKETLEVAVLTIQQGVINIKAVGGDLHLGDDIDAKLVDFCLKDFATKTQIQIDKKTEVLSLRRLTTECQNKKLQLYITNSIQICIRGFYNHKDLRCELTRKKFDELNNEIFVKSTDLVAQVLYDAKLEHSDIDDVVLVGETTRIPKIKEMLTDLFYGKPLHHDETDETVTVGAAIQAAILNGTLAQRKGFLKVLDVTQRTLGVKVKDGFMCVIIPRNSKVPNKHTKQIFTSTDNQKDFCVEIYEGEETMVEDNRKLGTFTLCNIPPGPVGSQQIEVNFMINDEGILHVKAKIMSSGEEGEIRITEHKCRLTNAELQKLIDQEEKNENCTEIRRRYYEEFSELGLIAIGNYGFVYKAMDKKDKKTFAIKKIPIVENFSEEDRKEADILSKLKSDFIVRLEFVWIEYNCLKEDDLQEEKRKNAINTKINRELFEKNKTLLLYIQMELCSMTLREAMVILNQKLGQKTSEVMTPLGYYLSSELFIEVLKGIDYLHKHNIIHRDLKPSNILITDGKNGSFIKVADFGLATIHEFDGQSHTKYKGTDRYVAPEVLRTRKYNTKADIYSLGVVALDLFNIDMNKPIEKTSILESKYSAILDVIMRMLSQIIAQRPSCETILREKSLWAQSLHELSNADKIEYKRRNHFENFKTCVLSTLLLGATRD